MIVAEKLVDKISIQNFFLLLKEAHFSIGVFKMPRSSTVILLADEFPTIVNQATIDLEQLQGFLVSPFEENETTQSFIIKPSFTASFTLLDSGEIESQNDFDEEFLQSIITHRSIAEPKADSHFDLSTIDPAFEEQVKTAIDAIGAGSIKKIVLARKKKIKLKQDFNPIIFFLQLCKDYPEAFVSLTDSQISGTWIGASPELLVSVDNKNIFRTVALAGTKHVVASDATSKASWTEKEIEEQALVCRYIIDCFKKIRLREYEEIGPKTVQAGNLLHLKTEYSVAMNEVNYENLESIMLKLLHPTSAVCGTPKAEAMNLIHEVEKINRRYYAGFLGPVNLSLTLASNAVFTSLFVNLRCMNVENNVATLFAGAGITRDSVPESEFAETESKFLTLSSKL